MNVHQIWNEFFDAFGNTRDHDTSAVDRSRNRCCQHFASGLGERMVLLCIFASFLAMMTWGADITSVTSLVHVMFLAAALALLFRHTSRREHVPSFTTVLVFIAAYCPSALKSIEQGFAVPLRASSEAVSLALLALVIFLVIAVGTGQVFADIFERPAKAVEYLVTAGRPELGALGFGAALAVAMIAAFRTGQWSNYAEIVTVQYGGIRVELLYYPLIFGFSAAIGRAALKEVIGEKIQASRAAVLSFLWAGTIVLLFTTQSRRMMLGALILSIAAAFFESKTISMFRAASVIAGLTLLEGILLVGSYLWRQQGPTGNAVDHILTISERSVDLEAAAHSFSQRLTYLWIDSVTIDHLGTLEGRFDLWDAFSSNVIKATPGLLMPEKYLTKEIVCEDVFDSLGIYIDLPCTPIAEGLLFGGIGGLVATAVFFGLTLGIVTALYRRGSFASIALAAVTMMPFLLIECSAFPIIDASRVSCLVLVLSALFAWPMRFLYEVRMKHSRTRSTSSPRSGVVF